MTTPPNLRLSAAALDHLAQFAALPPEAQWSRGIEKEGLRVDAAGLLSQTPHPIALGSALTHPLITTDFSESLLEFITEPSGSREATLAQMHNLHAFSARHIARESIWPLSMPCRLPEAGQIPIAQYGASHRARMKTRYREGLSLRYGRTMQTVAGVHYNVSFNRDWLATLPQQGSPHATGRPQDAMTSRYFDLLRNFRRYYWLLVYLFGSTPVVDSSFLIDRPHDLVPLGPETWGLAHATALRMGHLGYQSSAQAGLFVCYNGLASYTRTLTNAIRTPYPPYSALDKTDRQGQASGLKQLNTSLLQIENEFYSAIRPKRTAGPGETALTALCKRGVEYLEVRCLDLDPFQPEGISVETMQFIDLFLLFCVLAESPPCDAAEFQQINQNHQLTVTQGRLTATPLSLLGATHSLRDWGLRLIDAMSGAAELLDKAHNLGYGAVLQQARHRLDHPDTTPSAQVLEACQTRGHQAWGYALAESYTKAFSTADLAPELETQLRQLAAQSLQSAAAENTQISGTFDQYLTQYYQQYQDCCPQTTNHPRPIARGSRC